MTKRRRGSGRRPTVLVLSILMVAGLMASAGTAVAQEGLAPGDQMPKMDMELSAEGVLMLPVEGTGTQGPAPPENAPERLLPTMDFAQFDEAKIDAEAARADGAVRGAAPSGVAAPVLAAPLGSFPRRWKSQNIDGLTQAESGGGRPPDTHGAASNKYVMEIVNQQIRAFDKKVGHNVVLDRSLADHFGYYEEAVFDPRVVYDPTWDRWIWTAEAFPEAADTQFHFIAVSKSAMPNGPYYTYALNVNIFPTAEFWDYPQLGMTQDAVIVTANVFDYFFGFFKDARMFAISKARLYNGLGFSVPLWTGFPGTLAPPIVDAADQDPNAYFLAAPPVGTAIDVFVGVDLESGSGQFVFYNGSAPVPAYGPPINAQQYQSPDRLDSLDARFVNASSQVFGRVYNVHTTNIFPGFATPVWYEIDPFTPAVTQVGVFFASGTSHDFNASIATNAGGDTFVTWSSTDRPAGLNAQVRFGGRQAFDAPGVIFESPVVLSQSTVPYNGDGVIGGGVERWGDYSSVVIDPNPPGACRTAWLTNEDIVAGDNWGSQLSRVGYCP